MDLFPFATTLSKRWWEDMVQAPVTRYRYVRKRIGPCLLRSAFSIVPNMITASQAHARDVRHPHHGCVQMIVRSDNGMLDFITRGDRPAAADAARWAHPAVSLACTHHG